VDEPGPKSTVELRWEFNKSAKNNLVIYSSRKESKVHEHAGPAGCSHKIGGTYIMKLITLYLGPT